VLERPDDTICEANIRSVKDLLQEKSLMVRASSVGGNVRRTLTLDVETGVFRCRVAGAPETPLYASSR
jgi:chemotaxis receptor (MCP) glutamine deamidase CheD